MALIQYVTRIQFDFGASALISDELDRLGVGRPLLVTDPGVSQAGLVERVVRQGPWSPAEVFDRTPGNPTEAAALKALALYEEEGCDGVVALGGGSAIDLGKAVALLATHGGDLADYRIGVGSDRIGRVAPLLAVPTTAGTGAEVGRAASLILDDGAKIACVHENLIARVAVCDPELTLSLPPLVTAATGMDAMSHGIEAFLSTRENVPAGAIALDCVGRAGRWLERAVAQGDDREARWQMLMAALEGGLVLQKGLGAVHAATHPLGAMGHHHGTLNAILLPPTLRFNASHAADKIADLKAALALDPGADLADWVFDLVARLGLPTGLGELGVDADDLPAVAAQAEREHLNATNPRPAKADDFVAILAEAMG